MRVDRGVARSGMALLVVLSCLAAPAGAKEGFGSANGAVGMWRAIPPAVQLAGERVAVKVSGSGEGSPFSQRLHLELEKELAARSGRLVDRGKPESLVEVKILRNELADRWETRSRQERRHVGVDSSGKNIYQRMEVTEPQRVLVRSFSASWQVSQVATGAILGSGTIEAPFEGSFPEGQKAPEPASLETEAIVKTVAEILQQIAPGREEIAVLLPEGRLEPAKKLAAAGDWSRYRETVEAMAPSQQPEEEAYRLYALATANEALAYAAADPAERLKFLELAEGQYQQAIAANPGEKQFIRKNEAAAPPVERVKAALAVVSKTEIAKAPAAGGEVMDNAALVRMAREGKGSYAMLTAIKAAPERAFDLSPAGLAELSEAGVDPKIIARLPELSVKE
jgi:hypothetical protein